jgi:predicted anti-sigma-YlaC factor YlaD
MNDSHLPDHDASPCSAFRLLLDDLVADEVDAVTSARAEAHSATCAACRLALATARAYRRRMRRAGEDTPAPATLKSRAAALAQQARDAG